jgi:GAF domain-containing protein
MVDYPATHPERPGVPLVPVFSLEEGPPDAVTVAAWHLALSNLIGVEVHHDLLGLWLFPTKGGVVLLAPTELARDRIAVPVPSPHLTQHELLELEERVRRAGYQSVIAIPVRGQDRDVGLALFADLEPGRYGVPQALRLHGTIRRLVAPFSALASSPPLALAMAAEPEVTPDNVAELIARAAAESRNGSELLRLVSGVIHPLVPHERLEVVMPAANPGEWLFLSGGPEGQRWGSAPDDVSETVLGLVMRCDRDGSLLIPDLREVTGTRWPTYHVSRATQRIRSVVGVQLVVAGQPPAWLLLGGAAPGMYRPADREVLSVAAPALALRVQGFRNALDAEVSRAQLHGLQATQSRTARLAAMLASTPHWGEALRRFSQEATEALGYARVRFLLRLGEDRLVTIEPGEVRPLGSLPVEPLEPTPLADLLGGEIPFLVSGEGGTDLAVPLRVAGRAMGACQFLGGVPREAGHPVSGAQQLADVLAPHLELVRRGALAFPGIRPRPVPVEDDAFGE